MVIPEVPMPQEGTDGVDGYFCKHYKRKCMFVTPCCNGLYRCRFCHDEAEDHTLTREDVVTIECCDCKHRQGVRLPRSAVAEEISTSTTMDTDSNMDTSSVSVTPEPSPLREDMASSSSLSSFSSPPSPSSSVVRRLEFSEDEGSGGN